MPGKSKFLCPVMPRYNIAYKADGKGRRSEEIAAASHEKNGRRMRSNNNKTENHKNQIRHINALS